MRNFSKSQTKRKFFYTNQRIASPTLRVIDQEGKQLGILNKFQALQKAQELEMDLVLIAPKANPPVAKIINFKKFLYQEDKKQKDARRGFKKSITKDVKLSLFIAQADFKRLIQKAKSFVEEGHQVRLSLFLKGREIFKKTMAIELLHKFIANLGLINVASPPKVERRIVSAVVSRKK